jgi:hypothetical protein
MRRIVRLVLSLGVPIALVSMLMVFSTGATEARAAVSYPKEGQRSAQVVELQLRLAKSKDLSASNVTGYYGDRTKAAVKSFQRDHDLTASGAVSAKTWAALVKRTGSASSVAIRDLDERCLVKGRVFCVDKTRNKVYYLVDKRVTQVLDARFGCANMRSREGKFKVFRMSRNHVSSIYHTPMPYAMFFSGGQAVHYSADFAKRGYKGCSHGCVNVRDKSAIAWIFDQVKVGDRVVVYKS